MNTSNLLIKAWHWSKMPMAAAVCMVLAQGAMADTDANSALVAAVRTATQRFVDINVAFGEGFVTATPCVSGPDAGAMGVHLVLPSRIGSGIIDVSAPQALIYEPQPDGSMRFVGVEYIVLASTWASAHPGGGPPALAGNLLNLVGAPNRYGLPAFFELHVWAWQRNPKGSFADWNTHVTCDYQPLS